MDMLQDGKCLLLFLPDEFAPNVPWALDLQMFVSLFVPIQKI